VNELEKIGEFSRANRNMSESILVHHKPVTMHADFDVRFSAFLVAAGVLATPKL